MIVIVKRSPSVLAAVLDETGCVNLLGVTFSGEFTDFFTAGIEAATSF